MKKIGKIRKGLALMLASALLSAPLGALGAERKADTFAIRTGETLQNASGLSVQQWEDRAEKCRQEGLGAPVTREALLAAAPDAQILSMDGRIYMITGISGLEKIRDETDACRAVYSLLDLLQGTRDASLRLWSVLTMGEQTAYVFQQVYEGLTVVGSTVKLVTGPDGNLTAVFSSLAAALPESTGVEEIAASQAEEAAGAQLDGAAEVLPEYTRKAIVPVEETEDDALEVPDRLVWVVYSNNPAFASGTGTDLPYLAHFVGMDGEYIRSIAVHMPGDRAVRAGYSAAYAFEFMEKAEWTGLVTDGLGQEHELTVPVMRDTRTGTWYLADPERKIAVGEFWNQVYGDEQVTLVSQPYNDEWRDDDLITYANMIRVWDYYAELGWKGPDGQGTPVLMLRDLCLDDGTPVSNAAYAGLDDGWQCFAYGGEDYFGQALDVMAHEFTHCMTESMMNTNLYRDDMGAINEAMSDIMGNLCELSLGATEDTGWLMGENSAFVVRSMLDPHRYDQPEYVWDLYYTPNAATPADGNDYGGVHYNSSILNLVAARLCSEEGMPLENARNLWLTAALGMTPRTDYPRMASLLRWAVKASGNARYAPALERLIAESRMTETAAPETLPEGQQLVSLTLPDTDAFRNPNWLLMAVQLDARELSERFGNLWSLVKGLFDTDKPMEETEAEWEALKARTHLDEVDLSALLEGDIGLPELLSPLVDGLVTQHITWQSARNGSAEMVIKKNPTLYVLYNIDGEEMQAGAAVLLGNRWLNVGAVFTGEEEDMLTAAMDIAFTLADSLLDPGESLPETRQEGPVVTLPARGLEDVTLVDMPEFDLEALGIDPDAEAVEEEAFDEEAPAEEE